MLDEETFDLDDLDDEDGGNNDINQSIKQSMGVSFSKESHLLCLILKYLCTISPTVKLNKILQQTQCLYKNQSYRFL